MKVKPEVIAFSCYIWNMYYIEQLAETIKLIDNKIRILYGGPEVSYHSEEFLSSHVGEYVIEGEGEETYREFIQCLLENGEPSKVKALYSKKDNAISYGGKRPLMDMNKLVFPYTEEDSLENKIVYYETSRGCPYNCKYCLSSTIHGVRFLDLERAKKELEFLSDKKVKLIKFVDRTFNCKPQFAFALWQYLIELDTETAFHFEISADLFKDKEIELLKTAPVGRFQFEVGVQTTNDEILKNINRHIGFSKIRENIIKLQAQGNIKQHLDLIAGLPGEDIISFKKSFNEVHGIRPEEIQLGFLKVLKGTPMEAEAALWGIARTPFTPYEVLKTNHISYEELLLLKRVEEMVDKYYNSQKFNTILKYFLPKFQTPFDFYLALGNFFYDKGYLNKSISSVDYYKVFIEFNNEILKEDSSVLKEVVKFDYLRFNKKKWLPQFLRREDNRELEREFKDKIRNNSIKVAFKNIHLEDFKINIIRFADDGEVFTGNYYLLFDEENYNNIIDVTSEI